MSRFLPRAFAALTLLPTTDAHVEAGHDLGVDHHLRGRVFLQVAPVLFAGDGYWFRLDAGLETWFRENNRHRETVVRLSPEQIRYPVSGHLMFTASDADGRWNWGVFALHQSNHDVDTIDPVLTVETVAYEVYGAELERRPPSGERDFHAWAGMVYDRGTTLELKRQSWPFEHSIGGVHFDGRMGLWGPIDTGGDLTVVAHRSRRSEIPHVRLDAALDAGASFTGAAGVLRPFLRAQRLEDYQYLTDAPRYVLMLGLAIETWGPPAGRHPLSSAPEAPPIRE